MAGDGAAGPLGAAEPRDGVGVLLVVHRCRDRLRRLRVRGLALLRRRPHGPRCTLVLSVHPMGGSEQHLVVIEAGARAESGSERWSARPGLGSYPNRPDESR